MSDPSIPTVSSIQAAIKAGLDQAQLMPEIPGHPRFALVPKTADLKQLPREKQEAPRFLTSFPTFHAPADFIAYFNAWKDDGSRIWYSADGNFRAVFDYHYTKSGEKQVQARHADHQASLKLQRSPEWKVWAEHSEKSMGQQAFAEFIEDHARDLTNPDPVTMLRVASGLHATIGAEFRQATNQANGQIRIAFDETINGTVNGTAEEIPSAFKIGLRPFMGTDRYEVDCRLRYRIERSSGAQLKLHYKALHLDQVTEISLDAIVKLITEGTGVVPALGDLSMEAYKAGI